ncbi:MAG: divergent polysaccharide deacetylase family protein, partial [Campylobacterota bacterium]|nr:divergent polysaccharide deacetylase family protein [Campylobacterota bacterium]
DKERLVVIKEKEIITVKPKVLEKDEEQIIKKVIQVPKRDSIKKLLPKLAIIIDDVTTRKQMNRIIDIGYSVNMAFLPPNQSRKNSAKIIKNLNQYMIHLPLQAGSNRYNEKDTLLITDNIQRIDKRIKSLKTLYPKAKFINNHTGSKFTANKDAMDRLLQVLKKYNYTFIDSRTTARTVAKESAKKYGVRMLSRNIFLDNKKDKKYIQNQLKKAIKIAKRNGTAIAIGHPYNITLLTLKESKHLLKDVKLVYVNRL